MDEPVTALPFRNRSEAGGRLGAAFAAARAERRWPHVEVVLALPRGGVPVAVEVARILDAQLDVLSVRKLGLPGHEELAMGAIATGGVLMFNEDVVPMAGGRDAPRVQAVIDREGAELKRRDSSYRRGEPVALGARAVLIVDDGVATGATVRAAVQAARLRRARWAAVAVPVAPPEAVTLVAREADQVFALVTPRRFGAVGSFYTDFSEVSDDEVRRALSSDS